MEQIREWNQVKGSAQGLFYVEQKLILRYIFLCLFSLHLVYNGCLDSSQNRGSKRHTYVELIFVLHKINLELHL